MAHGRAGHCLIRRAGRQPEPFPAVQDLSALRREEWRLERASPVKIRAGYEIAYDCPQPTPMILALSVHPSRGLDLLTRGRIADRPSNT